MKLLNGKRTLITGGARGLGRAIALAFAKHGARVAFTYAKNEEAAERTRRELAELGVDALSYRVDAADSAGTEAMLSAVEKAWDGLDVLVNNAAITQNLPLALLDEEDFDRVMRVNVKGPFITSRAALRGMIRRKSGVIVNIGSLAGARMIEAPIHYTTSKAAIIGMTEALAKEVARHGIRVVCLAPGLLEDGLGRNLPDHRLVDYLHHCALGRVGKFEEVAEMCALLASDRSSYVSGETLVMDGGV
ncbi:MAG TPA: SDR family oxidoreductase [Polyangiaceae bacterium]|nr:SDR family oxidoreductase [Polyangiaceae bacterium]